MSLKSLVAKRRAERMSHIRPEIQELASRGDVTWDEYSALRMNSYEREFLYPSLTDDALVRLVDTVILPNCSRPRSPASTYDESLVGNFVPLLLQRLKLRLI